MTDRPPLLWRPIWWIAAGLVFLGISLSVSEGPRSRLWFAELPLYALMLVGLWRLARGRPLYLPLSRRSAPVAFVAMSWAFGMTYEASLTVTGAGIGGVHPDTRASYILAQGDYLMIALAALLLIRWLKLDFRETFFLAGGKSLTEGLIFTGVLTAVILSPMVWMAPLFLAYYTIVYACFMALPLLLIDPQLLWRKGPRGPRPAILTLWVTGFVVAVAIRVAWGLGWAPFATWLFDLPPNLPGL